MTKLFQIQRTILRDFDTKSWIVDFFTHVKTPPNNFSDFRKITIVLYNGNAFISGNYFVLNVS